jgi:hypothetical protein
MYGLCTEFTGANGCADTSTGKCGFQTNHNVTAFTTADLVTWAPAPNNPIFQFARDTSITGGTMFCPKMIYNAATSQYVLWYNWIVNGFNGALGVSVSSSPFGPWTQVTTSVSTLTYSNPGDFNLFQDDDGVTAYIIYTSVAQNHGVSVEMLTPNYQSTMGPKYNGGILMGGGESPALIKRSNGLYYAFVGGLACYNGAGANVTVFIASCPLGQYVSNVTLQAATAVSSQQTDVLMYTDGSGIRQSLWFGDHWQSAPDHLKGHDLTGVFPLQFDSSGTALQPTGATVFNISIGPARPVVPNPPAAPFCLSSVWTISPNVLYTFEQPMVPLRGSMVNPPYTATQPWTTGAIGAFGVASSGGGWDPVNRNAPPSGLQFAYMQNSLVNSVSYMGAKVSGLQVNVTYYLHWYQSVRAVTANPTNAILNVTLNNQQIYSSAPSVIGDTSGLWPFVTSSAFTPTASSGDLYFWFITGAAQDQTILFDSVSITTSPTAGVVNTAIVGLVPGQIGSFEAPVLSANSSGVTPGAPWSYVGTSTVGIASVGAVWDAGSPTLPPDGLQYTYIQANTLGKGTNVSVTLYNLTLGTQYSVHFYAGIRAATGTSSYYNMTVLIDGIPVLSLGPNMALPTWTPFTTQLFTPMNTAAKLTFAILPMASADKTLLLDAISVNALQSLSSSSSSSSSSFQVSSSSTGTSSSSTSSGS